MYFSLHANTIASACGLLNTLHTLIEMHTLTFPNAALPINAEDFQHNLNPQHYRIWRMIGTELEIDVEILNSIEWDHANDHDRLHAMIDSANPALTHEVITKVLQSERIANAVKGLHNCNYMYYVYLPCIKDSLVAPYVYLLYGNIFKQFVFLSMTCSGGYNFHACSDHFHYGKLQSLILAYGHLNIMYFYLPSTLIICSYSQ